MASHVIAPLPACAAPRTARRRCRALALPLLAFLTPGCEALERMDYLDRFFEPQTYAQQEAAPQPVPAAVTPDPDPAADRDGQAGRIVAMDPIPDPPAAQARVRDAAASEQASPPRTGAEERTRSLVRQNRWLTQFWMELTPAQQERVARRLNPGGARPAAAGRTVDVEAAWDRMGLSDRAKLVFGGAPAEEPGPENRRDDAVVARNP